MKKSFFCLVLSLVVILLSSTAAHAVAPTQDARYLWRDGGTYIDQIYPIDMEWSVGSPTGGDRVQINQKDFNAENGTGVFNWTVYNDSYADRIYSFHITNVGFTPAHIVSHTEPTGWTFSVGSSYFDWSTDSATYAISQFSGGGFQLVIPGSGQYGIGPAAVDVGASHTLYNGGGLWVASHPVPEPATLSLIMGIGLMGFVRRVIRKKFVA